MSPYLIPSVQFNAMNSPSPTITSLSTATVTAGTPFSFTITSTGVPTPSIVVLRGGKLPKGLGFHAGVGTATISGTALKTDRDKTYIINIRAKSGRNSVAKQQLRLTLIGGR